MPQGDAGRPDHHSRGDANRIGQAHVAQALAKRVVDAVPRVGQHAVLGRDLDEQSAQMLQGNPRLGCKPDVLGNSRLLPTSIVFGPDFRKVQLPSHQQAALLAG